MEVVCPNCSSHFNLPDTVKMGSKLRCSVCKQVFRLEAPAPQPPAPPAPAAQTPQPAPQMPPSVPQPAPQPAPPAAQEDRIDMDFNLDMPPKNKGGFKKFLVFLLIVLFLGGAGAGGWWWYTHKLYPPAPVPEEQARKVAKLSMRDVRQYYVENDKAGKIFVIEGKVVNGFDSPKDLIELEASIYGKDKKTLQSKRVLAGTTLSFFQLKVMGQKELDTLLSNKIEILANNTNVASGASVPFMAVFYASTDNVAEFGVRIVDVQESEATSTPAAPAAPASPAAEDVKSAPAAGAQPAPAAESAPAAEAQPAAAPASDGGVAHMPAAQPAQTQPVQPQAAGSHSGQPAPAGKP